MYVEKFAHAGHTYHFAPPIEIPDEITSADLSLGKLASYAVIGTASNLPPDTHEALVASAAETFDRFIGLPGLALPTLQTALKNKHEVR